MRLRLPTVLVALALLALLAALFAPTLGWLVRSWRVHGYYSHGLLVPMVAIWFAWRTRSQLTVDPPHDAGLALIVAGVGLHLAALRWAAHPLSAAGLLIVLAGFALLAGGRRALRAAAFPVALLALAIPLPFVERLAPPLAGAVARAAALAAGSIGVAVLQVGAQLVTPDGSFQVGAPCSGLRSILALFTLAVVLAGLAEGPLANRVALVGLAVPLALLANWLRLTGLLWLTGVIGPARTMAIYHPLSSPLVFLGAAAGLVAVAGLLGCHVRHAD
jgi:exosortase